MDKNKVEIEKIKETLESLRNKMTSNEQKDTNVEVYNKTTETWIR